MKLEINNFRHWKDQSFDFGGSGVVLISGKSGSGKCLGYGTKVLLYNGTIKEVQDLILSDTLMGDDNKCRNILSINRGNGVMFKIIPKIGKEFTINFNHILTLACVRKNVTDIIDISLCDYFTLSTNIRKKLLLLHVSIDFPFQEISTNSFVLGKAYHNDTGFIPENYKINTI